MQNKLLRNTLYERIILDQTVNNLIHALNCLFFYEKNVCVQLIVLILSKTF
jgi:hypothetical protein